ncbi:acetylglutamate kinase [Enterococcus sp.]|uniref:acetylglutamate kinase n=1 Tax=Enterococcus sp. TaxID=35783 RepID=UPI0025BAB669|nr:acetylglutamate kinase [Enterococcus sp.]
MEIIVIKMGGVASDNLTPAFFEQITQWQAMGKKIVIVHGGGHYISEMLQKLALPVQIKEGLRVTDAQTLEITRMVLLGQVQPMITTHFQQAGFQAVGLNAGCDQLIQGAIIDHSLFGYVGEATAINHQLLQLLLEGNHIPILAPLGITAEGQWLNINADEVACQVANSLGAEGLVLLTDVPGIKKESQWLQQVSLTDIKGLIQNEVVTGGMLPKLASARKALQNGVKVVRITNRLEKKGTLIQANHEKILLCE